MATAPEKQIRQGRDELNMSVMGDTCNDIKSSGDEHSHTYDVLNNVPLGKVNSRNNNEYPRANKGNVWLKSGVTVSRWMIILAVLLITALVSALTGVIVYHVTSSKMTNDDPLPQQDQDTTEMNRRLNTMQEKQNAFDDLVHGMREKQHAFDDLVHGMREKQHAFEDVVQAMDQKHNSSVVSSRDYYASIDRRLEALGTVVQTVQAEQNSSGLSSSYVRWGRNVCPGNAERIYKGYIGGKHYNADGSGSDSVCLPYEPTWLNYSDGNDPTGIRAHIYGTEIEIAGYNPFDYDVLDKDMPCAVCSIQKASSIMIPARNNCYTGWNLEYNGYLMAGMADRQGAYNHICMDVRPEFVPGGGNNNNEHILCVVEAQCGSLPCPPYVQGRELACAVCSK